MFMLKKLSCRERLVLKCQELIVVPVAPQISSVFPLWVHLHGSQIP